MKKILVTVVGTALACAFISTVHADTFNIVQTGTWSNASTWSKTEGSGGQTVPGALDYVSLSSLGGSRVVTMTANTTIAGFSYDDTVTASFVGPASGTRTLTITGDLTKAGTGSLRFTNGGSAFRLAVDGNLVIDNGTLSVGTSGTAAGLLTVSGSTIINKGALAMRIAGGTASNSPIGLGAVSVATSGTIRLQIDSAASFGPQYFSLTSLSGGGDIIAEVVESYSATLMVGMASDSTFSGRLRETGAGSVINLTKSGTGTLTLSGTSNYSGLTNITNGAISVSSIGSGAQNGNLGSTGGISLGGNTVFGRLIYTGTGETTSRQLTISGSGGGVIEANGAGALVFTQAVAVSATGNKTLVLTGISQEENKISGALADNSGSATIGVSKTGAGTWVLAGSNSYTGNTSVSQGKLLAENDAAFGLSNVSITGVGEVVVKNGYQVNTPFVIDGGVLTVNGGVNGNRAAVAFGAMGGRLAGSGTMNVAVALNNVNRTLAPGDDIGKMTLAHDQEWTAFTYEWKLDSWDDSAGLAGDAYSQIVVDGNVDLQGASQIVLSLNSFLGDGTAGSLADFSESDRSWVILTADSLNSFNSAVWSINTDGFQNAFTGNWSIGSNSGNVILTYQAVPEPATCLLLIGGVGLCFYRRFRKG